MNDIDQLLEMLQTKHESMGKLLSRLQTSIAVRKAYDLPMTGVYRAETVGSAANGFVKVIYDENDKVVAEKIVKGISKWEK